MKHGAEAAAELLSKGQHDLVFSLCELLTVGAEDRVQAMVMVDMVAATMIYALTKGADADFTDAAVNIHANNARMWLAHLRREMEDEDADHH